MSRPAKTAVKDTPPASSSPAAPAASRGPALPLLWPLLLTVLALAEAGLSAYQWSELLTLRAGGTTSCSISETVNCETVWNSAFASRVHALTGLPVAGLGVVWGLAALVVAGALLWAVRKGRPLAARVGGVRLVAAAGFLSCVTFGVASARAGALCPTCLGTYLLVGGFAVVAFLKLPQVPSAALGRSVAWAAVPAALAYLALLGPGKATPKADAQGVGALTRVASAPQATPAPAPAVAPSRPLTERERQVAGFIAGLAPMEQQTLADALAAYRASPPGVGGYPSRRVVGDASAPVKMVEWTDMLCPHCRQLSETLKELERVLPPGLLSVEARHFPLTNACNPMMGPSPARDANGAGEVRCVGAKVQICLEQSPRYHEAQQKLFAEQGSLTVDKVLEIGAGAGMSRAALQACVAAPQTQEKLTQDIRYAMANRLEGTPLVLLNGRQAPIPYGPFFYTLALLGGDADSPAYAGLPPPRMMGGH